MTHVPPKKIRAEVGSVFEAKQTVFEAQQTAVEALIASKGADAKLAVVFPTPSRLADQGREPGGMTVLRDRA